MNLKMFKQIISANLVCLVNKGFLRLLIAEAIHEYYLIQLGLP